MTVIHGNIGSIAVGTNVIAQTTEYSYDENVGVTEHKAQGDTAATYVSDGILSGGGSITAKFDPADTLGQGALSAGASVTVNLYPEGNTPGKNKLSGLALIESVGQSVSVGDLQSKTFAYKGVLTESIIV